MITVETPLKSIQNQREVLEHLVKECPAFGEYVRGAISALDWIEKGGLTPVERA